MKKTMRISDQKGAKCLVDSFLPMAEKLKDEGATMSEIMSCFRTHIALQRSAKRAKLPGREPIRSARKAIGKIQAMAREMSEKADASPERALLDRLQESPMPFRHQPRIGRYRVPFLIDGILVAEIDNPGTRDPERDRYLKGLGYAIMKISPQTMVARPEAVIPEIKRRIGWRDLPAGGGL
jgi:very-short-patch-repair endonuclease